MGKILNKRQVPMLFFTVACLAAALPVRILLLLQNTERSSGFYKENNVWVFVFYGLSALAVLVPLFYNMRLSHAIMPFGKSRSRAISFAGIAFAVSMLYDFINQTMHGFNTLSGMEHSGMLRSFYAGGGITMVLQAVFALIGAFYILIYAVSFFGGTLNYRNFRVIALVPALWMACRLVRHFLVNINYLYVSQRMLEMLMLVLAIVFFFQLAKLNACFPEGVRSWKLFGCGWGCFYLCTVLTLPRLILCVIGEGSCLPAIETAELVDLMLGFFVLMYLLKGSVVPAASQQPV